MAALGRSSVAGSHGLDHVQIVAPNDLTNKTQS